MSAPPHEETWARAGKRLANRSSAWRAAVKLDFVTSRHHSPMRRRRSPPARAPGQHQVAKLLVLVCLLSLLGYLASGFDRSVGWIAPVAVAGASIIFAIAGAQNGRRRAKVAARKATWTFAAAVAMLMVVCFNATLFWPHLSPALTAGAQRLASKGLEAASNLPLPATNLSAASTFECRVSKVHDGDTLRCADGARVRLHAVAAREIDGSCAPGHPCPAASAASARRALQELAGGQTIRCLQTGNSYDRITAICWNNSGREINCAMVRSGTTVLWERFDRQERICRT